jgi:mediator of RNA polymerase II transcription subunit 12, fungi type
VDDQPAVVPDALPEILLLATDPNPEATSILANGLWYKFRTAADWAWKVWDNVVASLRQIPSMVADPAGRRGCALRYSSFLIQVDRHLATGLDEHVLAWLKGSGRNEVAALSTDAWDLFVVVLVHLASHNSLTVTTILEGIVYPAWQVASKIQSPQQGIALESMLPTVDDLCACLLLRDGSSDTVPPLNFLESQGLQTGRRDVYREPHFSSVVRHIPVLVLLEQNANVPEKLRKDCSVLRKEICSSNIFRLATYRELDIVQDAFQVVLANPEVPEEKHEALISALRFIFNEGHEGRYH